MPKKASDLCQDAETAVKNTWELQAAQPKATVAPVMVSPQGARKSQAKNTFGHRAAKFGI